MIINFYNKHQLQRIKEPEPKNFLQNASQSVMIVHELFMRIKDNVYDTIDLENILIISGVDGYTKIDFVSYGEKTVKTFHLKELANPLCFEQGIVSMVASSVKDVCHDFPKILYPIGYGKYKQVGNKFYCAVKLVNTKKEVFSAVWFFVIRHDNIFAWSSYDMKKLSSQPDLSSIFLMGL